MEDPMAFINEVSNPDVLEQAISMYIRSKRRQSQDDTVVRGGSRPGKRPNINRQREFYAHLLHQDYWGPLPIYDTEHFRRNFKLPIELFDKIMADITNHDEYFQQKPDAAGQLGATPLQKICAAMRMLTSGVSAQELDDKFRLGSSTLLESLKRFCVALDQVYGVTVLRAPNDEDLNRLLDEGVQAGFPGCIGSIDCMHWQWKNCPSSWKGMFQGKEGVATVVLEAIADHRGRFWHFNFGTPGALNDINVLDRSPLFHNAVNGTSPRVIWSLNGHEYNFPYWLADGIYPQFACFLKTYPNPSSRMQKLFASKQEAKRKDIERAFGVLQARFHVLTSGCRLWDRDAMRTVIKACVILHNMIIDFERETGVCPHYIHAVDYVPKHPFVLTAGQSDRRQMIRAMKNITVHKRLQHDLMLGIWAKWSNELDN